MQFGVQPRMAGSKFFERTRPIVRAIIPPPRPKQPPLPAPEQECAPIECALPERQTMRNIVREVAATHGITVAEMLSPRRFTKLVLARQEAWWRCKKETTQSLPQIGAFFHRDHTTILSGIRHFERMLRDAEERQSTEKLIAGTAKESRPQAADLLNVRVVPSLR